MFTPARRPASYTVARGTISRRSLVVKRRGAQARVAALRERSRRIDQLCVLASPVQALPNPSVQEVAPLCGSAMRDSGEALVRSIGDDVQPVNSAVAAAAVGALFSDSNEVELAFLMRLIAEGDTATASRIAHRIVEAKRDGHDLPGGMQAVHADAGIDAAPPKMRWAEPTQKKTPTAPAKPRRTPLPAGSDHARGALSPRELNVLRLISQGLSNREIAESSYRSLHTVDAQVKNIYRKLAVNSRAQAVREAMQKGLINLEACG
ncbi:response regulator transcription factor [Variovorax sp. RCC_210]|uniref:response regulator transcription factor n=1 Tax=Variovorax sp. RCC_210 TaxID=3239217 RepID=UPI0035253BCF